MSGTRIPVDAGKLRQTVFESQKPKRTWLQRSGAPADARVESYFFEVKIGKTETNGRPVLKKRLHSKLNE